MQVVKSWNRQRVRNCILIEGFVIMPDHIHILIRGLADNVRKFMQYSLAETSRDIRMTLQLKAKTGNVLAKNQLGIIIGRANGSSIGKVWKERFRCIPLNQENAIRLKLDYMHRNPSKAELVDDFSEWMWSSYSHYAGEECVVKIDDVFSCGNS